MTSAASRKVVLFLPPYAGKVYGPPLGLLSLAASLRQAGYEPHIIDGALRRDWMHAIEEEVSNCLCFGVSLLTGPMIHDAIAASRLVRCRRPEAPIIFGGWHPSLLTAETLREDFVDMVVRHQGDKTLVEILDRITSGGGLDLVPGCWFKRAGRIHHNPDRPSIPLSDLPIPAYDLVDFDAYERVTGERGAPYATSIGCPYACNYCTDTVFYNRRFNPCDAARVVEEMTSLVRRHRLETVSLVDSNFLVDTDRATAIARGIVDSGVRFRWTFQASTDLLCRMADEEVRLLAASGVSHIGFGTESASPEVLRAMNKRHQNVPDIYEAARKCSRVGIRVMLNLILGYPGEEERHRKETLNVMGEIASLYENVGFSPNVFVPYPGIPIWPELRAMGMTEPASLEEWARIELGANTLPWLRGRVFARLQRNISYFLLDDRLKKVRAQSRSRFVRSVLGAIRRPLAWRLKRSLFDLPLELWLSMAHRWLVVRRSLLTGKGLSHVLRKYS